MRGHVHARGHVAIALAAGHGLAGRPAAFPFEVRQAATLAMQSQIARLIGADSRAVNALRRAAPDLGLPAGHRHSDRAYMDCFARAISEQRLLLTFVARMPPPIVVIAQGPKLRPAPSLNPVPSRGVTYEVAADIRHMSAAGRIGEALERMPKHFRGELAASLRSAWQAFYTLENATVFTAFLVVGAVANSNPFSGAVFDGAMVMFAYYQAGRAGIEALKLLAKATHDAANAESELDLEAAAAKYATSFLALGGAAFLIWIARRMNRKSDGGGTKSAEGETDVSVRSGRNLRRTVEAEPAGTSAGHVQAAESAAGGAANRAAFEGYKDGLRAAMDRPPTSDPRLTSILDDLYRPNATVGSGSTAAAVRQELATGQSVGGAFHSQKAADSITALTKWLEKNPTARPGDRAAAENVIRDTQNALRGQ